MLDWFVLFLSGLVTKSLTLGRVILWVSILGLEEERLGPCAL